MLIGQPQTLEKTVRCPKCGSATEIVHRNKSPVQRCQIGCGIWINQADLDSQNRRASTSGRSYDLPVGLWPARRLERR